MMKQVCTATKLVTMTAGVIAMMSQRAEAKPLAPIPAPTPVNAVVFEPEPDSATRVDLVMQAVMAATSGGTQEHAERQIADILGEPGAAGPDGPPCQVTCPPNLIPENEPCFSNTVNCGCDCAAQNFLVLRCPEGYCATSWAMNNQQDTDWYRLIVNDPNNDGQQFVCLNFQSDFPAVIELWAGPCGGLSLITRADTSNCVGISMCACVQAPAQYWVKIYPGTIAGGPILNNLPCLPPAPVPTYWIRYKCADQCPQNGACCFVGAAGPMCTITTQANCATLPMAQWFGVGSSCQPNPCINPTLGACCYQIPGTTIFQCIQTTQQDCLTNYFNGVWYANTLCTPDLCHDPLVGACCYRPPGQLLFQCIITTQQDCIANYPGGIYWGNGTTCAQVQCNPPPPTGACCYHDPLIPGFLCIVTTQNDCAQNYPNSTWMGANTTCNPNPCNPQTGACCYQTTVPPIMILCTITTQADCLAIYNGTYMGNNTTCTPNPCVPDGACCYVDAAGVSQCIIATQSDCIQIYQGIYQGNNTTCVPINPCVPTGACCYFDATGPQCQITTQQNCATLPGGTWLGANTLCIPNPCLPEGACCFQPAGAPPQCQIMTQLQCSQQPNSTWLGPNTSCQPNPCRGACCWQDAPNVPYVCTLTTQLQCSQLPNGIWHGIGSTCTPNLCPPTGACCYSPGPGLANICVQTTAQDCQAIYHGTFLGLGVPCTPTTCQPCVTPPPNMVAWWTFDEIAGGIAHDTVDGHHGAYKPTAATGPMPMAGVVNNALAFDGIDDHVQVPHSPALDFNCGPFSIDTWILPQSFPGGIVRKTAQFMIGYDFYVNSSGQLELLMTTSSLRCIATSTSSILPNTWWHVAVTVTGGGAGRIVTFYINGVPSGSSGIGCVCVGNNGPVIIGSQNFGGLLHGKLDELEIFNRVLAQSEISAIYNAGPYGKCRHRCHVPWDWPFCLGQNKVNLQVTVCNDSPVPQLFNVQFSGLPMGPMCALNGPTIFTPPAYANVNIPGNMCVNLPLSIVRPIGMNAYNLVSCYNVAVTNLNTGQVHNCQGSVQDKRLDCAVITCPTCNPNGATPIAMGPALPMTASMTNTSPVAQNFMFQLDVMDSETMMPSQRVSLNGLPPGTRYIGNLSIMPGETADVPFSARFVNHQMGFLDIVLSADLDGDGMPEPLTSAGIYSYVPDCSTDIAPPPVGSGFTDIDDLLLVINGWGSCPQPCPPSNEFNCPADVDNDCDVDIDDLLAIINGWGPCPF